MAFSQAWPYRFAVALCAITTLLPKAAALSIEYCSDINTSSNSKNSSVYQSNGLCQLFCESSYAFAILQYNGCWCSDYAPATNTTGCTTSCPGYPVDLCGGSGLYGYIALSKAVSGTRGATATTAAQVTVTAPAEPQTVLRTITETPAQAASSSSSTKASSPTSNSASQPLSDTTATWTPTPITSLETVTGQVRTVTVTPTVPPTSGSSTGITKTNSGGLSLSAAVGLTVGLVVLAAILVSLAYFCWQRRQKEKEREYNDANGHRIVGGVAPSRTMSESSRYVLNTDGRQVVESWEGDDDLVGSRRSRLMATVDPRLDPFAKVYQRAGDSKSRESFNTIRDDQDYSRRINQAGPILRATNPDPDTTLDR